MAFTVAYDLPSHSVSYVTANGVGRLNKTAVLAVLAQAASYVAGAPTVWDTLEPQVVMIGRDSGRYPCLQADGAAQVSAVAAIVNSATAG